MDIETRLAWRNVWRNPRRTALSVAATAFAVFLVVVMVGMATGVHEKMIEDAVRLASGHVAISGVGYRKSMTLEQFIPWDGRVEAALGRAEGLRGWAPRISSFALLSLGNHSQGGMVIGVDPARERSVTTFAEKVNKGRFVADRTVPGQREIVLGRKMADKLGAAIGDQVLLYGVAYSLETAYELFTLVGTLALPEPRLERNLAIIHIADASDFYVYEGRITEVALLATDADHADALLSSVSSALDAELGDRLEVQSYEQMIPELVQLILIDDVGMYITLVILIVVVGFGILNTILMAILERARELGVILALGLRPAALFRMIYLESMMLAGVGLVIGLGLAVPLLAWLDGIEIPLGGDIAKTTESFGMEPVMTFVLRPLNPIGSMITIVFVAALAALYPALKASRARPVDALRGL
ncbi:MAG: ABC transporter permease [Deltaproteobacteria bacterium]|nr:ABC transporter permease [Deltaproteobacteria bacterium]